MMLEMLKADELAKRNGPIVSVEQGKLMGSEKIGSYGVIYQMFLGIPYATPPEGELRFKDPQPLQPWTGVGNATQELDICTQLRVISKPNKVNGKELKGREDCLYLNIYVPVAPSSELETEGKPVMVWIHGVDFTYGSCKFRDVQPDYFMDKDVIIVTVSYRLGVLGFLNLGHKEASGNQGLKDLVAALTWIRTNIFSFGGDPNNVTIFGNGTGAIAAHLLMMSPLSKGLMHKAILQSGVALCNWAVRENQPEAFKLASLFGCNSKDPAKIVAFLRQEKAESLVQAAYLIVQSEERQFKTVVFGPTIDKEATNPFLPCSVRDLIDFDYDIPVIVGHNSHEYLTYMKKKDYSRFDNDLWRHVNNLVGQGKPEIVADMMDKFHSFFFKNQSLKLRNAVSVVDCMSSIYFNIPIHSFVNARRMRRNATTYFYIFAHCEKPKRIDFWPDIDIFGTRHTEEVMYLFYKVGHVRPHVPISEAYKIMHSLTAMWSNFAKTGDPNIETEFMKTKWRPATEYSFEFMVIDNCPTAEYKGTFQYYPFLEDWY